MSDVERRYSQTEKEALAVIWGTKRFKQYLLGLDSFLIISDHKPLESIFSAKSKPPPRIEKWMLHMHPYHHKLVYKPGPQNSADALSHLSQSDTPVQSKSVVCQISVEAEDYAYFIINNSIPKSIPHKEIESESKSDPEIRAIRKAIKSGNWNSVPTEYLGLKQELWT